MTVSWSAFDTHMMQIALRMARRGLGATAPNPAVGAVIVDEATGEVIARGWTQRGGRPHAEKEALRRAGARARGKTMYLTLEPCAHTGRVPTCADAMADAGLKRVVCGFADPNPVISGRGFDQLRAAGVAVEVGLLEAEARWTTLGHVLCRTAGRPFVQVKMALDAALTVAAGNGAPVWVTSPEARAFAHLLRSEADAIIVGSGTVIADDPELNCRLPGLADRSPRRVVIDGQLRTSPRSKVYLHRAGERPNWLATCAGEAQTSAFAAAPERLVIDRHSGSRVDLAVLLQRLAGAGTTRVMVEGGPHIWAAFLEAGLVDEALVAVSPAAAEGETISVVTGDLDAHFAALGLARCDRRAIGPDRLHVFRRRSA